MKIIIVEDEYTQARFLQESLKRSFTDKSPIFFCYKGQEEAVAAVSGEHSDFDVLFLDGHILGGSGGEVIKVMNTEQKSRTIITSASREFVTKAKEMGVERSMDKNFPGIPFNKTDAYIKSFVDWITL